MLEDFAAAILAASQVTRLDATPGAPQYRVVLAAPYGKTLGWVIQASNPRQRA